MNTTTRIFLFFALIATGALEAGTIKLASISPLSGSQAGLGETIKLGAQMAVIEAAPWFKEHGYELVLTPQDDQASPDVGVAIARRLVNDDEILGVIGHLNSGVAIPSSEVYKEYDLAMVSPANTAAKITERRYSNISRICGRDDIQGPVGAEFAFTELNARKIYIIHDKTAYGQGVAEAFRKKVLALGAKVVGFDGTEERSNFQSLILRMRVMRPDLARVSHPLPKSASNRLESAIYCCKSLVLALNAFCSAHKTMYLLTSRHGFDSIWACSFDSNRQNQAKYSNSSSPIVMKPRYRVTGRLRLWVMRPLNDQAGNR